MRIAALTFILIFTMPYVAIANSPAPILPDAVTDMDRKGWSKAYAAWGDEWMARLNKMQHKAAEKASLSRDCDAVELVGLSDMYSVPRKKAVFYIDCSNMSRIYVSDEDLKDTASTPVSVKTQNEAIPDAKAKQGCISAIKAQLNHPSTFDSGILSQSVYRAPTGNMVVTVDFKAKNGFGLEKKMTARCVYDASGMNAPEISER